MLKLLGPIGTSMIAIPWGNGLYDKMAPNEAFRHEYYEFPGLVIVVA
jgi:hypothetical protein